MEILMEPKIVWTYLNIADPIVAWETYRGVLISPDCYKIEDNPAISFWQLKFLKNIESRQSINELKLELIRQEFYPNKISRFRGFYYFESQETAEKAANLWGVEYMNPFCLTQVGIDTKSLYSKMNSNWITYYLPKDNTNNDWMHKYWQGAICPHFDSPIWELLVVARGYIYGTELRRLAYENIKRNNPTTILPMLEQARLAAWLGSDLGHTAPHIIQLDTNRYKVGYVMDMRDAKNEKYLHNLKQYIENPENKSSINYKDLGLINEYDKFSVPDARIKNFEFSIPTELNMYFDIKKLSHG